MRTWGNRRCLADQEISVPREPKSTVRSDCATEENPRTGLKTGHYKPMKTQDPGSCLRRAWVNPRERASGGEDKVMRGWVFG